MGSFEPARTLVRTADDDDTFEDKTTVFRPLTAASNTRDGAAGLSACASVPAPAPSPGKEVPDSSTAIFDGLFDSSPSVDAEPNTPEERGVAQQLASPAAASLQVPPITPEERGPAQQHATTVGSKPNAATTAGARDAQPRPRRSKPDPVPRKQKSTRTEQRPAVMRAATPRVDMARFARRPPDKFSAPDVPQTPRVECTTQSLPSSPAIAAPLEPAAIGLPARFAAHLPTSVTPLPQGAQKHSDSADSAAAAAETAALQPGVLSGLPLPALPPPVVPAPVASATRSGILSAREPDAVASVDPVRDGTLLEPRQEQNPGLNSREERGENPCEAPGADGPPSKEQAFSDAESNDRHHTPELPSGTLDSLFPSASSIRPKPFRNRLSRRDRVIVGVVGAAATVCLAAIWAVNMAESDATSQPPPKGESLRSAAPSPVDSRLEERALASPAVAPPAAASEVTAGDSQRTTARSDPKAVAQHGTTTRSPSNVTSTDRRSPAVRSAGAGAVETSSPSGVESAEDERAAWERGTVEKRAWMQPGF